MVERKMACSAGGGIRTLNHLLPRFDWLYSWIHGQFKLVLSGSDREVDRKHTPIPAARHSSSAWPPLASSVKCASRCPS